MSEIKLTQLYDKEGNALFPNMYLKTINGERLFVEEYEDGEIYDITITNGVDGSDVKFIYCLTTEYTTPPTPEGTGDNIVLSNNKGEWSDEPMGIDASYKYEWVSISSKKGGTNESFSPFSTPILWSKWGEDGKDGDGVEYIYKLFDEKQENCYPLSDEAYESDNEYVKNILQENDFVPNAEYVNRYITTNEISDATVVSALHNLFDKEWSDKPSDVSSDKKYEYVSIRRKKNGIWGSFSKATLWNEWHIDGSSVFTKNIFAAIDKIYDSSTTIKVSGGGNYGNLSGIIGKIENITTTINGSVKNINWYDSLPPYNKDTNVWMTTAVLKSNSDEGAQWLNAIMMSDNTDLQIEYSPTPKDIGNITQLQQIVDDNNITSTEELINEFRKKEKEREFTWGDYSENISDPIWMAQSKRVNGKWTDWLITRIKGEKGVDGATGSTIRGPRNWSDISVNTKIYSGKDASGNVEQWIDIVRDNDGSLYRCKITHNKRSDISLGNTTYFEKSNDFNFVATKLLLANNASIDFLSGNSIVLKNASGEITAGVQGGEDKSFWAGGSDASVAAFNVSYEGAIKATRGAIGNFIINDTSVTFDDGVNTQRTFGEGVMFAAGDYMTTFYTSGGINMYSIMPPFNSSNISNLKNSKKIIIDNSVGVHIDKHDIEVNTANIEVNNTNILINDGSSINNIVITPNLAHIKFAFKTDSSTKIFTKNTSNNKWQINGVDTSIDSNTCGYVIKNNKEWFICDKSTYNDSSVIYKTGVKTSDYTSNDGVIYFEI